MNTINCRIRVNEHQDVSLSGVTPTEAVLLRTLHDPSAATHCKSAPPEDQKNFWKFLSGARAAGVAMSTGPDGKDRPRTNAEEVARLRRKYALRAKSQSHGSHALDDLYPGQNPTLPESFEEIGMEVEAPQPVEKKPKKAATPEPAQ